MDAFPAWGRATGYTAARPAIQGWRLRTRFRVNLFKEVEQS